jgi:hypothetical protein
MFWLYITVIANLYLCVCVCVCKTQWGCLFWKLMLKVVCFSYVKFSVGLYCDINQKSDHILGEEPPSCVPCSADTAASSVQFCQLYPNVVTFVSLFLCGSGWLQFSFSFFSPLFCSIACVILASREHIITSCNSTLFGVTLLNCVFVHS